MNAVDTNVLVRFLTGDEADQSERARKLFLQAEQRGERFWVSVAVVLETLWVLSGAYGYTRVEILDAIEAATTLPCLSFESRSALVQTIRVGRTTRLDLPDALIGCCAREAGCGSVLTFDRAASRSTLFELLD